MFQILMGLVGSFRSNHIEILKRKSLKFGYEQQRIVFECQAGLKKAIQTKGMIVFQTKKIQFFFRQAGQVVFFRQVLVQYVGYTYTQGSFCPPAILNPKMKNNKISDKMKHRNDFLAMILSKIKIITIKNNDMKRFYKLLFGTVLFLSLNNVNAQKAEPAKMFKVYEENDLTLLLRNK